MTCEQLQYPPHDSCIYGIQPCRQLHAALALHDAPNDENQIAPVVFFLHVIQEWLNLLRGSLISIARGDDGSNDRIPLLHGLSDGITLTRLALWLVDLSLTPRFARSASQRRGLG